MQLISSKSQIPRITYWAMREIGDIIKRHFNVMTFINYIGDEVGVPKEVRYIDHKGKRIFFTGKLTKRIRRYCEMVEDFSLTEEEMQKIGNIIDNNQLPINDYYFKVEHYPYENWYGQFGDTGSCFYRDNCGDFFGFSESHDSYGIEFYDEDKKPYGRLLAHDMGSGVEVLMNGFCKVGRSDPTENLVSLYLSYRSDTEKDIRSIRGYEENPHLNGGGFYVIGEYDKAIHAVKEFTFENTYFSYPTENCICGSPVAMTEIEFGYCVSCDCKVYSDNS